MPKQKDLKRLVRARMNKTGESYSTARSQLIKKKKDREAPPETDWPTLAGMSDEAVRKKTGKTWKQWVRTLDAVAADSMTHREIAMYLGQDHDVAPWWAQTVTVGYERIRGLRDVGQRRGGSYSANKSKTFAVPLATLYEVFGNARKRRRWLPGVKLIVRKATPQKSMRMTWPDGTSVHVYFTAKGPRKSQVTIEHGGLQTKSDLSARKAYWTDRIAAISELLSTV